MKQTDLAIQTEIKGLREVKPTVRRFSFFNDDHHAAIDAQILVLHNKMKEAKVYELYSSDDDELPPTRPANVLDAALDAVRWMAGEYTDYPSLVDSWKELVVK